MDAPGIGRKNGVHGVTPLKISTALRREFSRSEIVAVARSFEGPARI